MAEKPSSWTVSMDEGDVESNENRIPRKSTNKVTQTFVEVLRNKYCTEHDTTGKGFVIVFHGKPKQTQDEGGAELGYLKNICVNRSHIHTFGLEGRSINSLCPNLVDLDLSENLLDSWSEILTVLSDLENLAFLNLARNTIHKHKEALHAWKGRSLSVENLVMNGTHIAWREVLALSQICPKLRDLHLCGNEYRKFPITDYASLIQVETLRLNDNRIESWEEIWKLRHLPNLKHLILSGNPLADIFYTDQSTGIVTKQTQPAVGSIQGQEHSDTEPLPPKQEITEQKDEVNRTDETVNCDHKLNIEQSEPDVNIEVGDLETKGVASKKAGDLETRNNTLEKVVDEETKDNVIKDIGEEESITNPDIRDIESVANPVKTRSASDEGERTVPEQANAGSGSDSVTSNAEEPVKATMVETAVASEEKTGLSTTEDTVKNPTNDRETQATSELPGQRLPSDGKPFVALESLCLTSTCLSKWKHLKALTAFPALKSVRMKEIKLAANQTSEDRRKLFVACLPNISLLNGSEVTETERDKAERHFLRHFSEKRQRPAMYATLEKKHGTLAPLVDIDIGKGYQEFVTLTFVHNSVVKFTQEVSVRDKVANLKALIARKMNLHLGNRLGVSEFLELYRKRLNSFLSLINTGSQSAILTYLVRGSVPSDVSVNDCDELHDYTMLSREHLADGDAIHYDVTDRKNDCDLCRRMLLAIRTFDDTSMGWSACRHK